MREQRFRLVVLVLASAALAAPVSAHHVVWLDFGNFNLNSWSSVNGNAPPTANDVAAVRAQVVANMAEDYALFDVYFTQFRPPNGRYTRVKFLGTDQGGLFGCAGSDCCPPGGTCTGIGSWNDMTASTAEVYAGSFSNDSNFTGANATTARVANGISHTASHELGHILDLSHCNAADDSITLGCSNITSNTNDLNVTWHVMASGSSWGLTMSQRATRDRFFSAHASRRILYGNFQAASHWNALPNLNAGLARADLAYGRPMSPTTTTWYGRRSNGTAFGSYTTWRSDAGDASDIFLTGDVNGDESADLVYGRILSGSQVAWYVRLSSGFAFGTYTTWSEDAGDPGDVFRLADVDDDGRDDLVYGRPLGPTTVRWYVRLSTGTSFGPYSTWSSDAGDIGDVFLLDDVDADGDADLAYGRLISSTQVKWFVRRSSGSGFGSVNTWQEDAGDDGDLFYLGDTGGDGDADLLYARTFSDTQVRWYFRPSEGDSFGALQTWSNDAGDAGDLFRLGDGNGDGFLDLFYARPLGMTSLTAAPDLSFIRWYGRLSQGGSFGDFSTWASDAGDEGDVIP
jgi:hypothetical protein